MRKRGLEWQTGAIGPWVGGLTWNGASGMEHERKLEPLHKAGSRRFHDVFKHQSSSRKWHRIITGNCKEAVRSRAGADLPKSG